MPAPPRANPAVEATWRATHRRVVRRRRLLVATTVVVAGLVAASAALATARPRSARGSGSNPRPPGTTAPSTTTTTTPPGPPYPVAQLTLPLIDTSRLVTIAGHTQPRPLPTTVWYPVGARGERPLVVFATGYKQCPDQYLPMLSQWAAAGFVVAAPTFPLTSCAVPGGPNEADLINEPRDLSFVTAEVLGVSAGSGAAASVPGSAVLRGRIDPAEVVVAGQSDGAEAAAAVAYNTGYAGTPVAAAMILSGELWPGFGGQWFPAGSAPSAPMLVVQGTADTVNPEADSQAVYNTDATGAKVMVLLQGADHLAPYEGSAPVEQTTVQVTVDFLDAYVLHQPGAAAALASAGNQAGVDTLVSAPGP